MAQYRILLLASVLLATRVCWGLRDVRVTIPAAILRGNTAVLLCHFDLEGDSLYSVKWYKGRREFYRFTPKEDPAMKIFPFFGLDVQQASSNATQLTLQHVHLTLSGRYSCEVSADAPSFHTALVSGDMDVVEVPKGRPVISGIRHRIRPDETLHGNCTSSWSKPAAKLTWFVNDNPPPQSNLVTYPVIKETDGDRESSYLGLKMVVKPHHFAHGRLKIRCSASIHDIYYQSTEKSIEEERPRGMLHGTLSTTGMGNGIQYNIQPPLNFITDLPPSGHRFEQDTQREVTTTHSSGVATSYSSLVYMLLVILLFTAR